MKNPGIACRIFDGRDAEAELETAFANSEDRPEAWDFGFDAYDCSIELFKIPPEFRLNEKQKEIFSTAGFATVFVNHTDGWETHYNIKAGKFGDGWRVHYHRQEKEGRAIEVERFPESWPKGWLETGYVRVVGKPSCT